jgi:NADH dehydrogenase
MDTLTNSTIEHTENPAKQKLVILGGGFGGIKTALEMCDSSKYEVGLVSDQASFRYYPSLYKTATGRNKNASIIALDEIFDGKPVEIIKDTVKSLDRKAKKVTGSSGKNYGYDVLVIALGVHTNYFGISGLDKYSYGIKTLDEAQRLRNHLHQQMLDDNQPDLNYLVVGGGPTGVELAGELPKYLKDIMKRHGLPGRKLNIEVIEAMPRLMPRMPERYSAKIARRLNKLGITLALGQKVEAETADALIVNGQAIKSRTVIWTAGITNHPFFSENQFKLSDHKKVVVDDYLQAEPDIYVIGDNAETKYSGMAQTALNDALFVTKVLKQKAQGKKPDTYVPKTPAYVTPVGPHWAAVLWGKLQFYGFFGWLVRELANVIGYHDIEPWAKASKHWLAQDEREESCPVCKMS